MNRYNCMAILDSFKSLIEREEIRMWINGTKLIFG